MPRSFCSLLPHPLEDGAYCLDTGLEGSDSVFSPRDSCNYTAGIVTSLVSRDQSVNKPPHVSEDLLCYLLSRFALNDQSIQFRTQSAKFRSDPRNVAGLGGNGSMQPVDCGEYASGAG